MGIPTGASHSQQDALILTFDRQGYTRNHFHLDLPGFSLTIEQGCLVGYNAERQQLEIANPDPRRSGIAFMNQAAGQANPSAVQQVAVSLAASEEYGSLAFRDAGRWACDPTQHPLFFWPGCPADKALLPDL